MAVLVDASVLYALTDRDEPRHGDCVSAIAAEHEAVVIPQPVHAEIAYLVNRRLGARAEIAFFRSLLATDWANEPLSPADMRRTTEILETYASADIGFVDAACVAIAERLAIHRIYTLDRRDFGLVRPAHVTSFEILP